MKKIFAVLLLIFAFAMYAMPVVAIIGVNPTVTTEPIPQGKDLPTGPQSGQQLLDLIDVVTNWIFAIFTIIALVMVLFAGLQFVTSGGDAAKVSEARQKLMW